MLIINQFCFSQEKADLTNCLQYSKIPVELHEKCLPWRDGKYITINEKGNFSTIEFYGKKNDFRLKQICKFPNQDFSKGYFYASPETGWIWTWNSMKFLCHNVDTGLNSDFIPVMSWKGFISYITPTSKDELLFSFHWTELGKPDCMVIFPYNQKTQFLDTSQSKERNKTHLWKQLQPFGYDFLAFEYDKEMYDSKFYFYNHQTNEKHENKLTDTMTSLLAKNSLSEISISFENKRIISKMKLTSSPLLIIWTENFENTYVYHGNSIFPKGKYMSYAEVSEGCQWMFILIGGYKGLNGELLNKAAFVEVSDKYPGKFSPIVFLNDEYTNLQWWNFQSFINHPEYGTCFICSYDDGKIKETRLYKMSDVQKEIDEIDLE